MVVDFIAEFMVEIKVGELTDLIDPPVRFLESVIVFPLAEKDEVFRFDLARAVGSGSTGSVRIEDAVNLQMASAGQFRFKGSAAVNIFFAEVVDDLGVGVRAEFNGKISTVGGGKSERLGGLIEVDRDIARD